MHEFLLDSSPQKSRISVKNPRVRPPKDVRSLIQMPSLNPTPSSPSPARTPVGFPGGGLGIGIKLPGRLTAKQGRLSKYSVMIRYE